MPLLFYIFSSNMDLILYQSSLNLTKQLIQRSGVGSEASEEVLESDVAWSYSIPYVNLEDEFHYIGTSKDTTPPVFLTLPYKTDTSCNIRQLHGREYSNPAFEIEFGLEDSEGLFDIQFMIGTYENGDDVLKSHLLRGNRLVKSHSLSFDENLIATILATNQNGLSSSTKCTLTNYDSSPPQARVIPFSDTTSHPNQFQVLLVLFDQYGITDDMEIAVGTTSGIEGNDLLNWTTLQTNRINQIINDEKFSFLRVSN